MTRASITCCVILFFDLSVQVHASTATKEKVFSVSASQDSTPHYPLTSQLYPGNKAISPFIVSNHSNLPSGLWLPPSWSFSIGLDWSTFQVDGGKANVVYSGRLKDNMLLPPWLTFNKDSITFDGTTPRASSPMTLELHLEACDELGHSIGDQTFNFTVADQELSSVAYTLPAMNVTAGNQFTFYLENVVIPYLRLDGREVTPSEGKKLGFSLVAGASDVYLQNHSIRGVGPSSSSQITVRISPSVSHNVSQYSLDVALPISVKNSYFTTSQISSIIVSSGEAFSFSFSPYLSNSTTWGQNTVLEASFEPKIISSWLDFTASPPTIHGQVPRQSGANHVNVTLTATDPISEAISSTSLYVSFEAAPSVHPGATASAGSRKNIRRIKMAVGLTLGIFGGFTILCCTMAVIRRSVGEQAQESKIRSGSRSKLKEHVIDHLQDGPYGGLEKERDGVSIQANQPTPTSYFSDRETDVEYTAARLPSAPEVAATRSLSLDTRKSPTMLKRDFFKPAARRPSPRNMLGLPAAALRKVSASSIKSTIQNTFSAFMKPKSPMPPISRPLPFTLKRVPPQRPPSDSSNPNTRRSLSSHSKASKNETAELSPSSSSLSRGQLESQVALHAALYSDGSLSLEGVVSLPSEGRDNSEGGVVGANSHVFVKKERFSPEYFGTSGTNNASRSKLSPSQSEGVYPSYGLPRSISDYEGAQEMGLRPDPSEEAVVSRAISVKVDRNSGPTARRYSSAAAAFEDTKRNTPTSSDQLLMSHLFGHSTGELAFSSSAPSITHPGQAVVKTKTHLRETPAPENGIRKVSNKVDMQGGINMVPSGLAKSSNAFGYGEDSWTRY